MGWRDEVLGHHGGDVWDGREGDVALVGGLGRVCVQRQCQRPCEILVFCYVKGLSY
jgi:hypothetical protein